MIGPIGRVISAAVAMAYLWGSATPVALAADQLTDAVKPALSDAPFASQRRLKAPTQVQQTSPSASSRRGVGALLRQGLLGDWQYVGFARRGPERLAWIARLGQPIQVRVGDQVSTEGALVVAIESERLQFRRSIGHGSQIEYVWPYLARKGRGDDRGP